MSVTQAYGSCVQGVQSLALHAVAQARRGRGVGSGLGAGMPLFHRTLWVVT